MANEQQAAVLVRGPGTGTSDSIPAALSDGELVIPADDVRRYGAAHLMAMVKRMGGKLPEPAVKEGVQHAAVGGLITDPLGQPTNEVTRVGNSYSGGNIAGAITVNGQAPGGTMSTVDPSKPIQPAPSLVAPTPAAPPPAGVVAPAAAPAAPQPMGMATGGQTSWSSRPQVARAPVVPAAPAAPGPLSAAAQPQQFFSQGALGFAQGGLVDERDLRRPLSAYAAQAENAALMGRRPPIDMGMAQEVPRTALPPGNAAPNPLSTQASTSLAPTAPAQPATDVIGRRPTINMGPADVVQPSRLPGTPAPLAQSALPAPEAAAGRFPLGRAAAGAGAAIGVGMEGKQVYDVATNPNSTGLDVASQAAQGVGRLGAAGAGAAGGAAAGSVLGPVGAAVGGIIGGGVGYFAADKAIAGGRALVGVDPRSPAEQLAVAAPAAPTASPAVEPATGGGAVFGIYPRPSSQFSTNANDAALQRGVQATAPGVFAPAQPLSQSALPPASNRFNATTDPRSMLYVPPETTASAAPAPLSAGAAPMPTIPGANASAPLAPAAGSLPAGVTRDGNSFSGTNVAAPPGSSAGDSSRAGTLGSMADTQAQLKSLQASNASVPLGGLTVINNPGPAAAQSMFDGAALRTAAARGAWSPRRGFQSDDGAIAAAALPLAQRAQQDAIQTREQGANQRAASEQQGLASRAQLADTRQAEANSIDRSKLGIDLIRATQSGLPAGYRAKADGSGLEPIPGGPADPNTPKGKNALTEDQAKSAGYAVRMENALKLIGNVGATNPGATRPGLGTALTNVLPEALANKVRPEDRQRVEAAQLDALDAALTLNTGAAYTKEQLQGLSRSYFAQPGDADKTVAEKQQRLNSLIDTARLRAGASGSTLADTAVQKAATANAGGAGAGAGAGARTITRTGTLNGRKVVQYSDGSTDYAD